MTRSIGQGYLVDAHCHSCSYKKTSLQLGMTAFADGSPSINHVIAYSNGELINADHNDPQVKGRETISNPGSAVRWRCPRCRQISVEFVYCGNWLSD